MIRWEYAVLEWSYEAYGKVAESQMGIGQSVSTAPSADWSYRHSWRVRYPGLEPQQLAGEDVSLGGVLNNLGHEGWELVSEVVMDRAAAPARGWPRADIPVSVRYTLKRAIDDVGAQPV
jgi:hypothetical protein